MTASKPSQNEVNRLQEIQLLINQIKQASDLTRPLLMTKLKALTGVTK